MSVKTVLLSSDATFAVSVGEDRCVCLPVCLSVRPSGSSAFVLFILSFLEFVFRFALCYFCNSRAIKVWDLRRNGLLKRVDVSCVRVSGASFVQLGIYCPHCVTV